MHTLSLAAPRSEGKLSTGNRSYGGTLIWGASTKPTALNPILIRGSVSSSLLELLFNRLVRLDSKGLVGSDLAEGWTLSPDGLVYTFYLRKGVRFHDGVECTAYDVEFTYDKIIDPEVNSPFRGHFQVVQDFKAIDKHTFSITLKRSCAYFIYRLFREITPKHLLEGADLEHTPFNYHPVGTGPFRFKECNKDNQIILEHNPDYYEGRPCLDRIVIKSFTSYQDAWTALMRGEVDFVKFIEQSDYEVIKDDPSFKAYAFPFDYYYAISYNLDDPILKDKRVREAIACGIDIKDLIKRAANGYGLESAGPFCSKYLEYNTFVRPFEYDPKGALGLLSEAGWEDADGDGVLEKDGKELEIRVLVDSRRDVCKRIVAVVRQQLQEIGIKIKVQLFEDVYKLTMDFLRQNRFQAHLRLFMAGVPQEVVEDWCSRGQKRFSNLWVYRNEEVDNLFELGEVEYNRIERRKIYRRINRAIYEDQPACFLFFPFSFGAVSNSFENTDELFSWGVPYYTMKDWYVAQTKKEGG